MTVLLVLHAQRGRPPHLVVEELCGVDVGEANLLGYLSEGLARLLLGLQEALDKLVLAVGGRVCGEGARHMQAYIAHMYSQRVCGNQAAPRGASCERGCWAGRYMRGA